MPTGVSPRNTDLRALLLTSRTLHSATLGTLYKNITIPHSKIFRKFLTTIQQHPSLGTLVRRLDFSHFNPATLFSTASERAQAKNLTSETLLQCLELTPYLQEFLAQEHIDDDLNADVLRKLFLEMPRLQALDFCGCSSPSFRNAFQSILLAPWPSPSTPLSITRLSLHKCLSLPSAVFETLLPRLGHLTHLDVAGTRITDSALLSLAPTARLTHLNLAKCMHLSARAVVDFLGSHPAACSGTLVFLSVASDARTHQLLDVDDVTQLLRRLNKTASPSLRSLSLKGSKMSAEHMDLLRPLTKHLEELALGRRITIHDINRLFASDGAIAAAANKDVDAMDVDGEDAVDDWKPHTLRYLDVSDLTMAELDLTNLFDARACKILVTSDTKVSLGHDPRDDTNTLEVFEIGPEDVFPRLQRSSAALARMGWKASEFGRRAWLVRVHAPGTKSDDGRRGWKWGATYWGMRKIPVARQDVGGMYGSFMFARNL